MNILATIKTENNEKFLILRRKYYDEVPSEDMTTFNMGSTSSNMSLMSLPTDISDSPIRRAPPVYRAPPQVDNFSYFPPPAMSSPPSVPPPPVMQMPMMPTSSAHSLQQHIPPSMTTIGLPILEPQTKEQYKECVNEFQNVMTNFMESRGGGNGMEKVDVTSRKNSFEQIIEEQASQSPSLPPRKNRVDHRGISRENSIEQQHYDSNREENKENNQNVMTPPPQAAADTEENKLSVKEAMLKFNRFASEEEAEKLIPSPLSKSVKSKTEKVGSNKLLAMLFDCLLIINMIQHNLKYAPHFSIFLISFKVYC